MKDLLDKLSSYDIFNFLLPGILFAVFGSKISGINLMFDNILVGAFIYYFIGLIISRIGSLTVEPFLKWIGFVKFAKYSDYIEASKIDQEIKLFSEKNNIFRTFISMFLLLFVMKGYILLADRIAFIKSHDVLVLSVVLIILFIFAYRKQTKFITTRINKILKKETNQELPS